MNDEPAKTPPAVPAEAHDGLWALTFVIGMVALVVSIVAVIGAFVNESSAAAPSGAGGSMETEFDITLGEMFVSPSTIEVAAGETITLNVSSTGAMAHDLKVMGDDRHGSVAAGCIGDRHLALPRPGCAAALPPQLLVNGVPPRYVRAATYRMRAAIDRDALAWLPQVELAVSFTPWAITFVGLRWTLAVALRVRGASPERSGATVAGTPGRG